MDADAVNACAAFRTGLTSVLPASSGSVTPKGAELSPGETIADDFPRDGPGPDLLFSRTAKIIFDK